MEEGKPPLLGRRSLEEVDTECDVAHGWTSGQEGLVLGRSASATWVPGTRGGLEGVEDREGIPWHHDR